MRPVKISENIYNIGAIDWNVRDFHGYSTDIGTTYNAYLILDKKRVLIDTVKTEFTDELLKNISQIIDPESIDLVISNHTEMDHSGGLTRVMHRIGADKPVYCSKMGYKNLSKHFHSGLNLVAVENGSSLSIGSNTLTFLETRMLHWPDSMFTYLKEKRLLFSSDAFGQHFASQKAFDDEVGDMIMPHAKKYFANILLLYSPLIIRLIDQVKEMGLEIDIICPDHGIIWRKDPGKIIGAYEKWSRQAPAQKAVIVYDTMWKSTEKMALSIAEGIGEAGVSARPMNLKTNHRSDVITELLDAGAIIVGSPTLNNGLFPSVADFVTYMKGLKPKNKIGGVFGSYGWSGEATKILKDELGSAGIEIVAEPLKIQYVPDDDTLSTCREFGKTIGDALKKRLADDK